MKVEQFAQILEIASTGSFSQASRNLFISQPALSYYVKKLEEEVGFAIFTRNSEGLVPTAEGRELLAHMKRIQRDFNYVQKLYHAPSKEPQISLRVAALSLTWLAKAFEKLVCRYSGSPINFSFLNYTSTAPILQLVSCCQVDFGVIGILAPYQKLVKTQLRNAHMEYHKLVSYPVVAVVGHTNPLYKREEPIKLAEIYPYTLLVFGNNDEDPQFSLAHALGLEGRTRGLVQVSHGGTFYDLIQNSSVVGLIVNPKSEKPQHVVLPGLKILPLADCDMQAEEGWIKLRRVPLTDVAEELLEDIKNNIQSGAEE